MVVLQAGYDVGVLRKRERRSAEAGVVDEVFLGTGPNRKGNKGGCATRITYRRHSIIITDSTVTCSDSPSIYSLQPTPRATSLAISRCRQSTLTTQPRSPIRPPTCPQARLRQRHPHPPLQEAAVSVPEPHHPRQSQEPPEVGVTSAGTRGAVKGDEAGRWVG